MPSKMTDRISILGVEVDPLTIEQANSAIEELVVDPLESSAIVVKPYVEFLVTAQKSKDVANLLNQADLCLADGVSLQWAASYLYGKPGKKFLAIPRSGLIWLQKPAWRAQVLPAKMAGATQTTDLLKRAERHHWKIGIIGGKNRPIEITSAIQERFPGLGELTVWSGYFESADEPKLVDEIAKSQLDILFVAMGFPRQELFMFRNRDKGLAKVMIGEGGTFDYAEMGGSIRRAPIWIQRGGLEWAWRLFRQPSRISRQLAIPRFVWAVKKSSKTKG